MEQNSRHNIGDTVYLDPNSNFSGRGENNPLSTYGKIVEPIFHDAGSWLQVEWSNGSTNVYPLNHRDLITEEEYLASCRKGASTIGVYSVNLEGATLDKAKVVIEDTGDLTRSTTTPSQKLSIRDIRVPTEDTVGIGEVDEVILTHYTFGFGKEAITKLADDIYEKARMNLSTSQSHELKDIVLRVLNTKESTKE